MPIQHTKPNSIVQRIRTLSSDAVDATFSRASATRYVALSVPTAPIPNVRDIFTFGIRLHEALEEYCRDGTCRRIFEPYIRTLVTWLEGNGVDRLMPDWSYWATRQIPTGRLDALLVSGHRRRGVLEIKTTVAKGNEPQAKHLCQLGGYLRLQQHWDGTQPRDQWAVLAYACPRVAQWHLHVYSNVQRLAEPAYSLLRAA